MRPRSFSTTTHLRSNWAGRQPREDAGTENATDKHNVQHYASQASHKEKANGTSGSAALDEEPSTEGKKGKEKVKVQFPAASKNGPIIGFEDERGGVSISAFGVWALGFGLKGV
ncbi:hypothetical protein DSL72_002664 [Monilinia vaccinii-corymbosi]|uniref:Uncharacterized protein n=1 Tax=Monilinia vaccinii-corymbosi TaxID=61207 RepID=A0A8A3PDC4_9HELO|nr:hypothetical protein DSL72_002664 [Monilinia vaccinii-corymbosi]